MRIPIRAARFGGGYCRRMRLALKGAATYVAVIAVLVLAGVAYQVGGVIGLVSLGAVIGVAAAALLRRRRADP